MLPVVWAAEDSTAILQAYNGLYLREEVQFEGLVRNIGSFARFMEAMSFAHASVLNLAAVSRECQSQPQNRGRIPGNSRGSAPRISN
jgi:hypothetical protein